MAHPECVETYNSYTK